MPRLRSGLSRLNGHHPIDAGALQIKVDEFADL